MHSDHFRLEDVKRNCQRSRFGELVVWVRLWLNSLTGVFSESVVQSEVLSNCQMLKVTEVEGLRQQGKLFYEIKHPASVNYGRLKDLINVS